MVIFITLNKFSSLLESFAMSSLFKMMQCLTSITICWMIKCFFEQVNTFASLFFSNDLEK